MPWPNLPVGELDRVVRSPDYSIELSYQVDGETETDEKDVSSEHQLHGWNLGERVIVHVRNIGGVAEVDRLPAEERPH